MISKQLLITALWLLTLGVSAQNIDDNSRQVANYRPEGRGFVSVNGENLYTRALYGGHTEYRVETGDRPVFAIFKKRNHRNIRFRINDVAIDSTDYCEALYEDGMRVYELRDKRWGKNNVIRMRAVASTLAEEVIWKFLAVGFTGPVTIETVVSGISKPRLHRNGDLGVDPFDAFEADGKAPLQRISYQFDEMAFAVCKTVTIEFKGEREYEQYYDDAVKVMRTLASRIQFNTPDPYINTLGSALVVAADGDWDGSTWLHGCVGWRMPLAGWRAGYLGDVLGWPERAISHFDAYANSQVKNVSADLPHPTQDSTQNIARAEKKWHTQMYSNGYICRNPNRNDQMHHYDMNLNYIDELLWHFQYDADKDYLRKMWPVLKSHLAWEKRNFDPDGDYLYDAYCCIWASDALYYNGGAVTHSSAYNYRANLLAARIAEILGEDPVPYRNEAKGIITAMDRRLWLKDKGHWAEYQDLMGLKRVHESAAVWSIYTPIDCEACTPRQAWLATKYIDEEIPHIEMEGTDLKTIATSNWMPYQWSINNVAAAEVMHTALAYFKAGRPEEGFKLMKANVLDQMYYGQSPGNFGQISKYDAARGECYRDFGDCIGISARTLIQGLYGIQPEALYGRCIIRPGFPEAWDSASIHTPYLDYTFHRNGNEMVYQVTQRFKQPLTIVLRQNLGKGLYKDVVCSADRYQEIRVKAPVPLPNVKYYSSYKQEEVLVDLGLDEPKEGVKYKKHPIDDLWNANVTDIFKQQYRSPRPPYTTLQIPLQGIGDWCHPKTTADINDSAFRSKIIKEEYYIKGIPFRTLPEGNNIVYTSLWDNYPDSIFIPMSTKASRAWLLMAGSTNHMQCRITNGIVVAHYKDGTSDTLKLVNPDNWCPIEQDYYIDGIAFRTAMSTPYRIGLASNVVSRSIGCDLKISGVEPRRIPGGAAQLLGMRLNKKKKLEGLTLRTLSNDVVIGLMAITLE